MKEDELKKFFIKELKPLDNDGQLKEYYNTRIDIDFELEGDINISDILQSAIMSHDPREEEFHLFDHQIELHIGNKFDRLKITNRFPQIVIIDDCCGFKLDVSEHEFYGVASELPFLNLYVNDSEIGKINITSPIDNFSANNLFGCQSLSIQGTSKETSAFGTIELSGVVGKCIIKNLKTSLIAIEQVLDSGEVTLVIEDIISDVVRITSSSPGPIHINRCELGTFRAGIQSHKDLWISDIECRKIGIFPYKSSEGVINLRSVRSLKSLLLLSYVIESSVHLNNLTFKDIYLDKDFVGNVRNLTFNNGVTFHNFTNQGELYFENVTLSNQSIRCISSVLGKTSFFNCKLLPFIEFASSNIEQIQFYGSRLQFNVRGVDDKALELEDQTAAFRQLKIASVKIGDKEFSNVYRAKELSSLYKKLTWDKDGSEKLAILLGKTNKHGQNWFSAFLWIVVTSLILYSLFILSIGFLPSCEPGSLETFGSIWPHYFEFLIPGYLYPSKNKFYFLMELSNVMFDDLNIGSKIIIFINDILVMPYLIIQMVSAFRKHAGKD